MKSLISPFKKTSHFLLVNLVLGIICCFIYVDNLFEYASKFIIGSFWGMLIFTTQWIGHAYLQTQISKRFSWIEQPFQRLFLTILSVVIYGVVGFLIIQSLMTYIVFGQIPTYVLNFDFEYWLLPASISLVISIILAAFGFYIRLKKSIEDKEKLKREMLSYKYEVLKNQINPHFMFNSLNVLSDLVLEDPNAAVKFIHEFSDIYRYVLDSREKELVPLKEEVEFIEKFIFLLKMRFENKLEIDLNIPSNEEELIVPLSLQLLVENAVKHNEISSANPLKISLKRLNNQIIITNPIKLKTYLSALENKDSKKIGLKNLQQQFSFFSDIEPIISENEGLFTVKIPILKKQ